MRANGYRSGNEIILHDGKVLDGRNRLCAATELLIDSPTIEFGTPGRFTKAEIAAGPLAYVLAINLHHRHLSASQRAMVAARIATLPPHRPANGSPQKCGRALPRELPRRNSYRSDFSLSD
jgi:hypothetical protein